MYCFFAARTAGLPATGQAPDNSPPVGKRCPAMARQACRNSGGFSSLCHVGPFLRPAKKDVGNGEGKRKAPSTHPPHALPLPVLSMMTCPVAFFSTGPCDGIGTGS